ncbi:nucleotidyltransferase domain-containing protein [Caldivirga maquilingensis]|uniref:Polymerase beta nucleotidyltransferase domain-containing protein n=1 Tax=Caldivirga maquilingensis (strain ATCC 700844 / DSM 13496 / JCM 10307 / IC-167) TaxID=397948 RepID=A8M9V2_CALMQ|nr:nucleotidyltransferase domain-containing protein [Caldivirga maquilingensis]ABW02423.1 conserved hypothetical protein [Caldivirga maquilingensis IC-167]
MLGEFPWRNYGVVFAVLYGSRAWGGVVKGDWDIAVYLEDAERDVDLQYALARFLGVRDEDVDLLVLNDYESIPCTLVTSALGKGKLLYTRDIDEYLDIMLRILKPCIDFIIDSEKLDLLGTQFNAVVSKWGQ